MLSLVARLTRITSFPVLDPGAPDPDGELLFTDSSVTLLDLALAQHHHPLAERQNPDPLASCALGGGDPSAATANRSGSSAAAAGSDTDMARRSDPGALLYERMM